MLFRWSGIFLFVLVQTYKDAFSSRCCSQHIDSRKLRAVATFDSKSSPPKYCHQMALSHSGHMWRSANRMNKQKRNRKKHNKKSVSEHQQQTVWISCWIKSNMAARRLRRWVVFRWYIAHFTHTHTQRADEVCTLCTIICIFFCSFKFIFIHSSASDSHWLADCLAVLVCVLWFKSEKTQNKNYKLLSIEINHIRVDRPCWCWWELRVRVLDAI